jgi:hypothetical protein
VRNPGVVHPALSLVPKGSEGMLGEDDDMNEPLRSRPRIMSERLEERDDVVE